MNNYKSISSYERTLVYQQLHNIVSTYGRNRIISYVGRLYINISTALVRYTKFRILNYKGILF